MLIRATCKKPREVKRTAVFLGLNLFPALGEEKLPVLVLCPQPRGMQRSICNAHIWVYQILGFVFHIEELVGLKCAQNRQGRSFLQKCSFRERVVYVPLSRTPVWCEYNFHFEKIDFIDWIEKDRPGCLKGINTILLNPAFNPVSLFWGSSLASRMSKLVILGGTVNRHMSAGLGPPERADLIIRMASSCTCLNKETSSVSSSGEEAFNHAFFVQCSA